MRFGYADPPYPGMAHMYRDHPDYGGEVDHKLLIERLVAEYPDGWALSTACRDLVNILPLCPHHPASRLLVWCIPDAWQHAQQRLRYAWQPVILAGGRRKGSRVSDYFEGCINTGAAFWGAKPESFCFWLFRCLGALPGDTLDDLFPGSGAVGRAWEKYQRQLSFIHMDDDYSGKKVKLGI